MNIDSNPAQSTTNINPVEQTTLLITDTLVNLISIHQQTDKLDENLNDSNEDVFLKQYLAKLLAYLGMSDLKLIKQNKKLNKMTEQVVRISLSGDKQSSMSSPNSSASQSSNDEVVHNDNNDEENDKNNTYENSSDTQDQCEYENKQVFALYDEAWLNFEKLRHVYTLEVIN